MFWQSEKKFKSLQTLFWVFLLHNCSTRFTAFLQLISRVSDLLLFFRWVCFPGFKPCKCKYETLRLQFILKILPMTYICTHIADCSFRAEFTTKLKREERLITLVHGHPELFDPSSAYCSETSRRSNTCRYISSEAGTPYSSMSGRCQVAKTQCTSIKNVINIESIKCQLIFR